MFSLFFGTTPTPEKPKHKEGDLYKTMKAHGVTIEIRYGYYEDIDRLSGEPMEIYPNFIESPVYTDKGMPFVTAMQKSCQYYKGEPEVDNTCYQCWYYEKCEELLGICKCKARRKKE